LTVNQVFAAEVRGEEREWAIREALWELPAMEALPAEPEEASPLAPRVEARMTPHQWNEIVTQAVAAIHRGEMEKVVLSHARRVVTQREVNPPRLLARLGSRYPDCYRFLFEPQVGHTFFGATPELLAERRGRVLGTFALAGSTPRGHTLEEDQALGEALLHSEKDRREHALVVRAIRAALAPLSEEMHLPDRPRLLKLNNIQHLLTPVRARLTQGTGILSVVEAFHPTPAVGGLPREAALAFIERAEPHDRGWYAAPIGWIDSSGDGLFAVALRSAVSVGRETHLFAGAGIVAGSQAEKEWRETGWKFRPILDALCET
jgi:menaquinone-specific isochorismate synthase